MTEDKWKISFKSKYAEEDLFECDSEKLKDMQFEEVVELMMVIDMIAIDVRNRYDDVV